MAKYFVEDTSLTAVADAIREKTGDTATIPLTDMGGEIQKVYDAGKHDEWSAFWDAFQQNGERTDYESAFSNWPETIFAPKYDIKPIVFHYTFSGSSIGDLAKLLSEKGVLLDTSNTNNFIGSFLQSRITHIPAIDTRGALSPTALQNTFMSCSRLQTIDNLILKDDGSQTFSQVFLGCPKLENITITGCIGQSISFSGSAALSHDSLMSIINALQEKTSGTWNVTLGSTNLAKLTDAEKAIATEKGWTLT